MKIAILFVSLGKTYWQYTEPVIESARKHLLKGHKVDFLLWTDEERSLMGVPITHGATIFKTGNVGHPYATLMRYHLFLSQEEKLKEYDYLFYCDIDMLFVDTVGNEILSDGLTATAHPGYAFQPVFTYPFEPNVKSQAYVNNPKFYFAGGFQGGTSKTFITAMYAMKQAIDEDLNINYIARWHDESHWNRYLLDHPPTVILDPSYCYPVPYPTPEKTPYDAGKWYKLIWGRDFPAKLLALTKKHTLSKEGGEAFNKINSSLEELYKEEK